VIISSGALSIRIDVPTAIFEVSNQTLTVRDRPASRKIRCGKDGRRLQQPWREWTAPAFEVGSEHPVPAGIDGEAVKLEPPLRFSIRPGVLRVRIAPQHPGASPSATLPESLGPSVRALARIAVARDPAPATAPNLPPQLTPKES
jgi:hypothetical protein